MRNTTVLTVSLQRALFLLLGAIILAGCPKKTTEVPDEPRVTSSSEEFKAAARSLVEPCNNPAEFGRCGCYLDGFKTSCDLVLSCLEAGFCELEKSPAEGAKVTSQSATFSAAAKSLLPACNISAEFGRCGCLLDGLQTSCDLVNRCLRLGFCVRDTAAG